MYGLIGFNAIWFVLKGATFHIDLSKNILDLRLFYTLGDVQYYFDSLGEAGRKNYIYVTRYVDSLFPILYGTLLILQTAQVIGKYFNKSNLLLLVGISLSLGIVIFDFMENNNTRNMLISYPNISEDMVQTGEKFTQIKWTFATATISFMVLLHFLGKKRRA